MSEQPSTRPQPPPVPTQGFSVVICQNSDGKLLAVHETRGRGWWLPAGKLEPMESFAKAALRETLEEAGIQVELKGILRVEHNNMGKYARMRVVYYATPVDDTPLKSIPDEESIEAKWVTVEELEEMKKARMLRGDELLSWGLYLQRSGVIHPMSVFTTEWDKIN